jgi:uncharacterized membrane protein
MPQKTIISKNNNSFLKEESRKWTKLGIISEESSKKINSLYIQSEEHDLKKSHNLVSVLAIFGSIMIGAGIIIFYAMNWSSIPKIVKVLSILAFMIVSYYIGYLFRYDKNNFPKVGATLIFLGAIIYGAGIALIMQIFNINTHWPTGFLLFLIGIIWIAYLLESNSILFLSLFGFIFYIGSESAYWFQFVDRYYNQSYALFLIFLSTGIFLYGLGMLHEKKLKNISYPFHLVGSFVILAVIYLFSFKWFGTIDDYIKSRLVSILFESRFWIIYLIITFIAIVIIVYNILNRNNKSKYESKEILGVSVLLIITPLIALFSTVNFTTIPIFFNIILFLLIIGVVYLGFEKEEATLINLGFAAFGISVFSRYIEYLWDYLNGYLFFIIGGVLLIFLSIFLENRRRKMIESINN